MSVRALVPGPVRRLARFRLLDVDRLYRFTRDSTAGLRPWMCDASGVNVALDARYELVALHVVSGGRLDAAAVRATEYWRYITAPVTSRPRDGGETWQYGDPDGQVARFRALIDSIMVHGYVNARASDVLDGFETRAPAHLEVDAAGAETLVDYRGREFAGLVSVVRHAGYYSALNGLHRLTVLKYLRDTGRLGRRLVPVLRVG